MPNILIRSVKTTPRFEKKFNRLPLSIQKLTIKKKIIFEENPFAPQLKTHKLRGKLKDFYSFSVNRNYRVLFRFINKNGAVFYDIGTHEIYQ